MKVAIVNAILKNSQIKVFRSKMAQKKNTSIPDFLGFVF